MFRDFEIKQNNELMSAEEINKILEEEKICSKCESDYADSYYKDKYTGEIICEDCLLEIPEITTSTIKHFYLDGDYIGNDDDNIDEVIDSICEYKDYEKV